MLPRQACSRRSFFKQRGGEISGNCNTDFQAKNRFGLANRVDGSIIHRPCRKYRIFPALIASGNRVANSHEYRPIPVKLGPKASSDRMIYIVSYLHLNKNEIFPISYLSRVARGIKTRIYQLHIGHNGQSKETIIGRAAFASRGDRSRRDEAYVANPLTRLNRSND